MPETKYIESDLIGTVTLVDGTVVVFIPPDEESSGVREPRRPVPSAPGLLTELKVY